MRIICPPDLILPIRVLARDHRQVIRSKMRLFPSPGDVDLPLAI